MSDLAATVMECFRVWDRMKAEGGTIADRDALIQTALRQCWPFTREWKYLCATCDDLGLEMHRCPGDATCGRSNPHYAHDFGKPCWCSAGQKFRPKGKSQEDIVSQAARTRPMTRAGR